MYLWFHYSGYSNLPSWDISTTTLLIDSINFNETKKKKHSGLKRLAGNDITVCDIGRVFKEKILN